MRDPIRWISHVVFLLLSVSKLPPPARCASSGAATKTEYHPPVSCGPHALSVRFVELTPILQRGHRGGSNGIVWRLRIGQLIARKRAIGRHPARGFWFPWEWRGRHSRWPASRAAPRPVAQLSLVCVSAETPKGVRLSIGLGTCDMSQNHCVIFQPHGRDPVPSPFPNPTLKDARERPARGVPAKPTRFPPAEN
jgi:hypothetical protein